MTRGIFNLALSLLLITVTLSAQETQPQTQPQTQPAPEALADMPEFQGISQWFNGPPLSKESLKGKVVLVDFWTYTCINCLRTLPHLKYWHQKYKDQGLVIVGVHSPEFEFEKDPKNVKMAIDKFKIPYPIALDNQMATWTAYKNEYWPAHYFIDRKGKIRHTHFGEGEYEKSEEIIRKLLSESSAPIPKTQAAAQAPIPEDLSQIQSSETYLGFLRRERLVTSGRPLQPNEWSFEGKWTTGGEGLILKEAPGKIQFRFQARKVNLVIHPGSVAAKAVVRLDGQVVSPDKAGRDVQNGTVLITEPRLYEIINLGPKGETHTVEIEFLTPGASVFAFTFG